MAASGPSLIIKMTSCVQAPFSPIGRVFTPVQRYSRASVPCVWPGSTARVLLDFPQAVLLHGACKGQAFCSPLLHRCPAWRISRRSRPYHLCTGWLWATISLCLKEKNPFRTLFPLSDLEALFDRLPAQACGFSLLRRHIGLPPPFPSLIGPQRPARPCAIRASGCRKELSPPFLLTVTSGLIIAFPYPSPVFPPAGVSLSR